MGLLGIALEGVVSLSRSYRWRRREMRREEETPKERKGENVVRSLLG